MNLEGLAAAKCLAELVFQVLDDLLLEFVDSALDVLAIAGNEIIAGQFKVTSGAADRTAV
jgi:hypothetical protein